MEPAAKPAAASTLELVIHGISFQAPQPFSEGHRCSAGEAAVLNGILAENLKSNFSKKIKDKDISVEEAQKQFAAYAASYVLSPRPSIDPTDRAALRIAGDLVKEALNAKGQKPGDLADGLWEKYVAVVAAKPNVRAEAKRRVEATKSIVSQTLDLDGIGG
jgi:hypothetical protein